MRSVFNPVEWKGFSKACLTRPWHVPIITIELATLVFRRIRNKVVFLFVRDRHYGLKKFPSWLSEIRSADKVATPLLSFPLLNTQTSLVGEKIKKSHFNECDIEIYFQQHRWASCLEMILTKEINHDEILLIKKWIKSPPNKSDPAWEAYSCSERIANLSLLLSFNPILQDKFDKDTLLTFYIESGNWLVDHLEYYGENQTNNHFLNNGRALIIAGVVLNHQDWTNAGLTIFRKFAPLLFSSDGFLREGSSHYQFIVAGWYFDGIEFAKTKTLLLESDPLMKLAYQIGFACEQLGVSLLDMQTHIGDISPDINPKLSWARLKILYPYWFDSDLLSSEANTSEQNDWLFLQTPDNTLLARWSKHWPITWASHSHSDLGSFIWRHQEKWILVDPGRIDYTKSSKKQLSAGSHNTILIDGIPPLAESVLVGGIWFPRFYTKAQIQTKVSQGIGFKLLHDGFTRVHRGLIHAREVILSDDGLRVVDDLQGSGGVSVELIWHFAPGFLIESNIAKNSVNEVEIVCNSPNALIYNTKLEQYTYSESYGVSQLAFRLVIQYKVVLPCSIETQFIVKSLICVE